MPTTYPVIEEPMVREIDPCQAVCGGEIIQLDQEGNLVFCFKNRAGVCRVCQPGRPEDKKRPCHYVQEGKVASGVHYCGGLMIRRNGSCVVCLRLKGDRCQLGKACLHPYTWEKINPAA